MYNKTKTKTTAKMKTNLLALALILISIGSRAQSVAVISREKLFPQLKGFTEKQAASDTLRQQLSREVQKQHADLQKKYQDLMQPYAPKQNETRETLEARMSKVDQERLKLLEEEQKLQDTRINSFNRQLDEQYARDLKPYMTRVETALQQYAEKNKTDMVWYLEDIRKAVPYYNKARDITTLIAGMVNKAIAKE